MKFLNTAVGAAFALLSATPALAQSEPPAGLLDAAKAEGEVVWYETTSPDQIGTLVAAFEARFPEVKLKHVHMTSFEGIGPRLIQESQAGLPTADVVTTGADVIRALNDQGLLRTHDWDAEIGITAPAAETEYAVAQVATVFVVLSNTDEIDEADVPTTWDALADEKWHGKLALWANAYPFAMLAKIEGEEEVGALVDAIAKLEPLTFPGAQAVTQAVISGEAPLAVGLVHTSLGAINDGAPVRMTVLDPVPVAINYSATPSSGKHPEAAKLLLWWLATPEGAQALEAATFRGNIYAETNSGKLIEGKTVSTFPIVESEAISRMVPDFTNRLRGQ